MERNMSCIKYQSRVREVSKDGDHVSLVYVGSHAEMLEIVQNSSVNGIDDEGRLKSVRLYQESPNIWCCEKRYARRETDEYANAPSEEYGKKSASLDGAMLSLPLRKHPHYRMCWDHQLIAAPGVSAIPSWWETATSEAITPESDGQNYRWQKPGDTPLQTAVGTWRILKQPTKQGVESFDWATYTITERAKFRSSRKAGKMVKNKLNQIGQPVETFGITGGNWKCDHASISWNGNCWVAQLVWTRSGDDEGWDADLYGSPEEEEENNTSGDNNSDNNGQNNPEVDDTSWYDEVGG